MEKEVDYERMKENIEKMLNSWVTEIIKDKGVPVALVYFGEDHGLRILSPTDHEEALKRIWARLLTDEACAERVVM